MKRRDFLRMAGMGAAALALPGIGLAADTPRRKPNVVFILVDDMGWRDVGFMVSSYYETPRVDARSPNRAWSSPAPSDRDRLSAWHASLDSHD